MVFMKGLSDKDPKSGSTRPPAEPVPATSSTSPPAKRGPITMTGLTDAAGPAVDAVYLPPGHSVYVCAASGSGCAGRYLLSDTGVRFAVADDSAARMPIPDSRSSGSE